MNIDGAKPIDVDELLLSKRLEPLAPVHVASLEAVERCDVSDFTEAEVRYAVIDPVVRILGYDKGSIFSLDLEHRLTFLGKDRKPDYQLTLWNESFWLIEAKKPQFDKSAFEYGDLAQAIEYSVHPSVNAALVVLCDGIKFEVFDREVDVENPVLRIRRESLARDFDKLRALLEPMQIWFFQKRRILRLLDRVFNREFNMSRVEEFSDLLRRRLEAKWSTVLANFRLTVSSDDSESIRRVEAATIEDLTQMYMFFSWPIPITNSINLRLVDLCQTTTFHVIYRMFPDAPRVVNDNYMAQAVTFLVALAEKRPTADVLPSWLARGGVQINVGLDAVIKFLLRQCLTYFADYEPYRLILLAACTVRRIAKIFAISSTSVQRLGRELHALARHVLPEISWSQIVASPEQQLLGIIDSQSLTALTEFVRRSSGKNHQFHNESAKRQLREYWAFEAKLLTSIGNYPGLRKERSLGELYPTESSGVMYDNLGHLTLCLLTHFPRWNDYLLAEERLLVEKLTAIGSWRAKEMLGLDKFAPCGSISDDELASRFFLGDIDTLRALRSGYTGV